MLKMLQKFVLWFICFGLSFFVEFLGFAEQGKAFLFINLGANVLIILVIIAILIITGIGTRLTLPFTGVSFLVILVTVVTIAFTLFATWGATQLFDVDFYITFQIMTFGQCLCSSSSNKNDN